MTGTGPGTHGEPPPAVFHRPRLDAASFAVLATHGPDNHIDLVPCTFAVVDHRHDGGIELVTAVDHKPKRHRRLARLANVTADPEVTLLVDHRDPEDWGALWWVRIQGRATVTESGCEFEAALDALVAKYRQYQERRPEGPVIRIAPRSWAGWTA